MKNFFVAASAVMLLISCQKVTIDKQASPKVEQQVLTAEAVSEFAVVTPKKFLFDNKKAETAGNADWVIDQDVSPQRIPTPLQSTITASTPETYWKGAISSWGIALAKKGHTVETLPSTGTITYGSTTNVQDLSKYDVYVVDEANIRYTTAEKTAIINFVKNGGGLFIIVDHTVSDRNNDGWDSPAIWNDLFNSNAVQVNPFGFKFDLTNFSQTTTNVSTTVHPTINGTEGNVTSLIFHNGASMTLTTGAASRGLIWKSGVTKNLTNLMAAYSTYGTGRVFAISDSSPADDGTGAAGNNLFYGWTDAGGNHSRLHMNASLWLAKLQ
ncbi:MAG: hypothetical protein ACOYKE_06540 [Ferruginibacter sp.]